MDTSISTYMNTLWSTVYADPTLGNRALGTKLKPEPVLQYWNPFVAFKLVAQVTYVHTTGEV